MPQPIPEPTKASATLTESLALKGELPAFEALPLRSARFVNNLHATPAQRKMRLYELVGTVAQPRFGELLTFDYAPEEFTDSKETEWKAEGVNVGVERPEFETSKGRTIAMTLFLNDWGEDPGHKVDPRTVEEKISWLRARQVPVPGSLAGKGYPPVLAFVWREVFKCVLTRVDVTRLKLDPNTLSAIRANVDIELLEWVPKSQ